MLVHLLLPGPPGKLSNRRLLYEMPSALSGGPDGAQTDSQGYLWACLSGAGQVSVAALAGRERRGPPATELCGPVGVRPAIGRPACHWPALHPPCPRTQVVRIHPDDGSINTVVELPVSSPTPPSN